MAFKLYECDGPGGLPLLEVPDGKYIYERLSPGTIAEANHFDTFRWVQRGKGKVLLAKSKKDPDGPMRLLRVRHPKKDLKKILAQCKSGKLAERRKRDIERVDSDLSGIDDESSLLGTGVLVTAVAALLYGIWRNK